MNKQFEKYVVKKKSESFFIEEDLPEVGWYLYRIDKNGKITNDYLQNSKKNAIKFAEKMFDVSPESWKLEK